MRRQLALACSALVIIELSDIGVSFAQEHDAHFHHPTAIVSTSDRQISIAINARKKEASVISVQQGESIQLVIHGEAEAIYHLHGYNLMAVASVGDRPTISFQAEYTGRYPLILHNYDALVGAQEITLAYIEVRSQ